MYVKKKLEQSQGSLDLLDRATGDEVRVLRAVIGISQAVLGAQHFDDVLEVIAEQSLQALDAASFSISRWERQRGALRTLINVGELGPGKDRWPADEGYSFTNYGYVLDLLRQGQSYVSAVDDEDETEAPGVALLRQVKNESQLAVPVMHDSVMWGELWASSRGRRFGPHDVRLLESIAAQMSVAIGRAELFSEVSRYAYEDPLTRLANRRGLDECLCELFARDTAPTLLVCDVDGLKEVNDRDGHPAGDALLRGVASALRDVASEFRASVVARIGGDEFCVVLPDHSLTGAERFARIVSGTIARQLGPGVTLCWGAAARDTAETSTAHELIAAADAALIEAKRLGRGRLRLRVPSDPGLPMGPYRRRESVASGRRPADALIGRHVELLDQIRPTTTLAALELLAFELCQAANAAAWSVSATTDDFAGVRTVAGVEAQLDPHSGLRVVEPAKDETYSLADYPSTEHAITCGSCFVAGLDIADSDPAEVETLRQLGYRALLAVGVRDSQRGYLLEVYSDGDYAELAAIACHARVLAHYSVHVVTR